MADRGIRKPQKTLSPRFVETVTEPGKHFDGQGPFLRGQPNGAKQWVQRITIRGKRCELGLGSPPAISLATARKLALEHSGKAMLGGATPFRKSATPLGPRTFPKQSKSFLSSSWTSSEAQGAVAEHT